MKWQPTGIEERFLQGHDSVFNAEKPPTPATHGNLANLMKIAEPIKIVKVITTNCSRVKVSLRAGLLFNASKPPTPEMHGNL